MNIAEFLANKYGNVMLTTAEVAEVLRFKNTKSLSNAILAGRLPGLKREGKTHLYHVEAVAKVLETYVPQ